jgi:amidase
MDSVPLMLSYATVGWFAPGAAPRIDAADEDIEPFRQRMQRLTCIARIAGLPQGPIGLSLIGPPNADLHLLELSAASF